MKLKFLELRINKSRNLILIASSLLNIEDKFHSNFTISYIRIILN